MKREDLYKLRKGRKTIEQLKEQIAALETRRISPRSAAYGTERVQSSAKGDIQPDQIAKIDDLIEIYRDELTSALDLQAEFEQLISTLEPYETRIMRFYYIDALVWEEIWQKENICVRQLMRIHKRILAELFPIEA